MYVHDQLMKARHDEMLRAAARDRLAAQARRVHTQRPHHPKTAPTRRPAVMRLRRLLPETPLSAPRRTP